MIILKRIEVDINKERERITRLESEDGKPIYNKRQQKALLTLCDLFEKGDWQGCLDHVNNKRAFPYNTRGEYPETEHIGREVAAVLCDLGAHGVYTIPQVIEVVKKFDKKPIII